MYLVGWLEPKILLKAHEWFGGQNIFTEPESAGLPEPMADILNVNHNKVKPSVG